MDTLRNSEKKNISDKFHNFFLAKTKQIKGQKLFEIQFRKLSRSFGLLIILAIIEIYNLFTSWFLRMVKTEAEICNYFFFIFGNLSLTTF